MRAGRLTLRFPDGARISGASARAVLAAWQAKQWHPTDDQGWRDELAKRAYIWSNTIVDPKAPTLRFLLDLERAGLYRIERG